MKNWNRGALGTLVLVMLAAWNASLLGQTCFTITGPAGASWYAYTDSGLPTEWSGVLPEASSLCLGDGCYQLTIISPEGTGQDMALLDASGLPVPVIGYLDDTYLQTTFSVQGVLGCADPYACNFDPAATCNASMLCDYGCYGCTDPAAFNYEPEATLDNGTCCTSHWAEVISEGGVGVWLYGSTGWLTGGATGAPFCVQPGCYSFAVYPLQGEEPLDFSVVLEDGSVWVAGNTADWDPNAPTPLELEAVAGCTATLACNFDPAANCDNGTCEYTSCAGCMDPAATNFDPAATYDNGTCCFGDVGTVTATGPGSWSLWGDTGGGSYGTLPGNGEVCLASGCLVFSCSASDWSMPPLNEPVTFTLTGPDGTVLTELTTAAWSHATSYFTYGDAVAGCLDASACNYDSAATCWDPSLCDYGCYGCTDPAASNFDAEATIDNGACCQGPWYTVEATQPIEWWWYSNGGLESQGGFGVDGFCWEDGCFQLHAWSLNLEPFELVITGPDGEVYFSTEGNVNPYFSQLFTDDALVGCGDVGACNYNPAVECPDYALCDYGCYGCTDAAAANFDAEATLDDGSCCDASSWYSVEASGDLVFVVFGAADGGWGWGGGWGGGAWGSFPHDVGFCWAGGPSCFQVQAFTYQPEPVDFVIYGPDGVPVLSGVATNFVYEPFLVAPEGEVAGCTDTEACNYDPAATCDVGNCLMYCGGCLDPAASNYQPDADFNDGTCVYGTEFPNLGMVLVPDGDQFWVAASWTGLASVMAVVPSDGDAVWMAQGDGNQLNGPYPCGEEVSFQVHDVNAGMALAMSSPVFTMACAVGVAEAGPGDGAGAGMDGWQVFPNPASGEATLAGMEAGAAWRVWDAAGREVASGVHAGGLLTLNVGGWSPGLYVVHGAAAGATGSPGVRFQVR